MTSEEQHIVHRQGAWAPIFVMMIGLALYAAPVHAADERARDISAAQQADVHHARATQLFQEQAYAAAAQELEQVYALEPKSLYLFNIAQAYRRAGMPHKALAAYERFVAVVPEHPLAREASGYAQDMRALIAEQQRAAQEQQEKAQMARLLAAGEQEKAQMARLLDEERSRRPFYRRAWFWGTLSGVTVATLAVGLGVGLYLRTPPAEGGFMSIHF